jgi:hypothetical protein
MSESTAHRIQVAYPDYLSESDDYTHDVRDEPLWSENYLSQAYSPATETGIYMHFNRPPFDNRLWHDIFVAYLPNDEFLVAKGFTPESSDAADPRGAGLEWTCDEPFRQWTKRFHGAVRHVSGDELRAGPLRDGMHTNAEMEIVYRALSPAFDVGALSEEQNWAVQHYEQHCEVTGYLDYGGKHVEFDGTGLRDHSWGPRDLSFMGNHVWLHGQFADGRTFMCIYVNTRSGEGRLNKSVIGAGEHMEPVELLEPPLIERDGQELDPYVLQFRRSDGSVAEIRAEVLQGVPIALVGPSEMAYGVDDRPDCTHVLYECQARFEWDGVIGHGLSERTVVR